MTDAPPEEERRPEDRDRQSRRKGGFFGISAIASGLLSGIVGEKLAQTLNSGGWLELAGYTVTAALAVICGFYYIPPALRERRRRRQGITAVANAPGLHSAAEEAERWMVALGSGAGGMAAAEWFSMNESDLRELLLTEKPRVDTADDLARICDALEVWYLRRSDPGALLELSEFLTAVADGCGRRDLTELAAARAATAYRLMGDVEAASTRLGISDNVATHSRTAAALTTRRQVERALLHLERAERSPAGNDREEAVLNARDRLDDARLSRPGPDLAAEVAIQINLAIVYLYQQDAEGALDQLRPANARATAAGDVSGQAHASELMGVAAWMQRSPHEARRWWQHAEHLYAEIDEREGRARCLQHLGSAEVVAGRRERARELLEQSALLRGSESELLSKYLEAAREIADPPAVSEEAPHQAAVSSLRRVLTHLRSRVTPTRRHR
jgi:tetratricopeptide (TPR) repeat protein